MKKNLRRVGVIVSGLIGLQLEAVFYFVFGINPVYIPWIAIVGLWLAMTVMVGCVVDEILKRKFGVRIVRG